MVKKRRKAKSDRCQPIRDAIEQNDKMIASIKEELDDPDIPTGTRRGLEALLRRLEALGNRLDQDLAHCEAIPD